jgi:hypothetical protein
MVMPSMATAQEQTEDGTMTSPATALEPEERFYEIIDAKELGRRLSLPESWVRDQSRSLDRIADPIPSLKFGKYRRYRWNSPELNAWLKRQLKAH